MSQGPWARSPVIRITLDAEQAERLAPLLNTRLSETGLCDVLCCLRRAWNPFAQAVTVELLVLAVEAKVAKKIVELAKASS